MKLPHLYLALKSDLTALQTDPARADEHAAVGEYRTWSPDDPVTEASLVFVIHRGRPSGMGLPPADWHRLPHLLDVQGVAAHVRGQPPGWKLQPHFDAARQGQGYAFPTSIAGAPAGTLAIGPTDSTFQLAMSLAAILADFEP